MFEYLTNKDYRNAKDQYSKSKNNIKKLNSIKNDITNDSSSITTINKKIDYIYEDFSKMILNSSVRNRVNTKLNSLKEPYQLSDPLLINACDSIDAELGQQRNKMNSADKKMNNIKNDNGGGSW